jgi:nitrate/nitrite transporter NarK
MCLVIICLLPVKLTFLMLALVQMACGATYGVVPFVSKRGYGLVTGIVGGGGSTGSAVTTAIFFSATTAYTCAHLAHPHRMARTFPCTYTFARKVVT